MAVEIIQLKPADWQRFKTTRLRSLAEDGEWFGSTYDEELQLTDSEWEDRLGNDKRATFAAKLGNELVGLVSIGPPTWDTEADQSRFYLGGMWVGADARSRGVGAQLLEVSIDFARRGNAAAVELWVNPRNSSAARVYERRGFIATDRCGEWPEGSGTTYQEYELRLPLTR